MNKHTSGPWKAHDSKAMVWSSAGEIVADCTDSTLGAVYCRSEEEAFANAELIAQAPALLEEVTKCRAEVKILRRVAALVRFFGEEEDEIRKALIEHERFVAETVGQAHDRALGIEEE